MLTVKVKFGILKTMANQAFVALSKTIVECLQLNNMLFPSPTVPAGTLQLAVADLEAKNLLAESDNGSHNDRLARDVARNTVYEMLVLDGLYCAGVANSKTTYDERKAVITASGFPIASDTHNPVEPVVVTDLRVDVPTVPGERTVKARWKRGKCDSFIVMGTQDDAGSPTTQWTQLVICSKAQCEVELQPGQWSIRVIGLYSAGPAEPSTDVSFMIS